MNGLVIRVCAFSLIYSNLEKPLSDMGSKKDGHCAQTLKTVSEDTLASS